MQKTYIQACSRCLWQSKAVKEFVFYLLQTHCAQNDRFPVIAEIKVLSVSHAAAYQQAHKITKSAILSSFKPSQCR